MKRRTAIAWIVAAWVLSEAWILSGARIWVFRGY